MKNCDAMQSTVQHYIKYDYQKVDPVQTWLHDGQADASGGLKHFQPKGR